MPTGTSGSLSSLASLARIDKEVTVGHLVVLPQPRVRLGLDIPEATKFHIPMLKDGWLRPPVVFSSRVPGGL